MSRLNTEYQKRISLERDAAATGMNVVRAQTETTSAMKEAAGTAANLREHYGAIVDLQNELARGAGAASTIFGGPSGPAGYTGFPAASDLAGLVALAKASGGGGGGDIARAIFGGGSGGSLLGGIRGGGAFTPGGGNSLADILFGGAKGGIAGVHMATMLTMEVASQLIPAAVAAAAGAAVGYQGGVAAYQRGTGILQAAGEALGGAYGVTPGGLFGMGCRLPDRAEPGDRRRVRDHRQPHAAGQLRYGARQHPGSWRDGRADGRDDRPGHSEHGGQRPGGSA